MDRKWVRSKQSGHEFNTCWRITLSLSFLILHHVFLPLSSCSSSFRVAAFQNGSHDSFFLLLDLLQETLEQRIERWRKDVQQQQGRRRRRPGLQAQEQEEKEVLYHDKVRILQEIGAAVDYLHARGVIFRDLKPANIGFSAADTVQIFDFGLSRELPTLDTTTPFHMSGKVGTVRYMAPEVATTQPYTVSADVYSWSIVAYELLSLHKPYHGFTKDEHTTLVCQQGYRPDLRVGVVALDPVGGGETCSTTTGCAGSIPSEMQALLQQSWCTLPHHRWTMAQINSQLQQWLRCWNTSSSRRRRRTTATTASSSSSSALLLKDCHPRPFFHEQPQPSQQQEDPMPTPIGTHACIAGNHNSNNNNTNVDECCYPRPFYHKEQHQHQHQFEHRHYPHQMPAATATNTTPSTRSGNSSSHNSFYIDNLPSCSRMLDDKKTTYQDAAHHGNDHDHRCAVAATMVSNDQLGMSLGAMSFESIETINTTSWMMLHEENDHDEETAEPFHPPRRRVRARILSTDDDAGILPPSSSVCLDGGKLSAWYTQQQQHAAGYY